MKISQIFTMEIIQSVIIKREVKLKPQVETPLHTDFNADKGKITERKSSLYSGT